ncbi:MAG: TetR/AcrR family transcriptional regulator [Ktedonobacteraceae bacterium]
MDDPERRRGRVHNAEGAREAILNAAETVFAKHGFDGARVDAIAKTAGYNKSLLFQYFGDKLGLYEAVTRRADKEITEFEMRVLLPLLEDETIASDARRFKIFLETIIGGLFDYLLDHPRLTRIVVWEQAEGWQTYTKFLTRSDVEDADQFRALLHKARRAGLLRSDVDPIIQLTIAEQMCWSYLTSIPLYQILLADEDLSSAESLARAREYIVAFVVHGMMIDKNS